MFDWLFFDYDDAGTRRDMKRLQSESRERMRKRHIKVTKAMRDIVDSDSKQYYNSILDRESSLD